MNHELPQGWVEAEIGSFNFHKGASITPSGHPDEIFELYSVPIFPTGNPEYVAGKDIGSSKQLVIPGDVLLCKINPRINRVWVVSEKTDYSQIASSEWIVIRNQYLNPRYLINAFSRREFRDQLCSEVTGVGGSLTRAQPKKVAGYSIPLAPLPEQNRIADKLDRVLARVNAAQARLDKIPALIKRFRQSVLAAATSGELTREWRESSSDECQTPNFIAYWSDYYAANGGKHKPAESAPITESEELPEGWSVRMLGEVCSVYVGATPSRKEPDYWGGDISWVSSSEVAFCRISSTKECITSKGLKNTSTTLHPPGTVMLAMIGQGKTRGQAAILDIEACHNQNTAALRVPDGLLVPEYLYYFLFFQYEKTRKIGGGNNQQALNKKTVQSIELPYPPVNEQHEIVRRVESLFALADTVEKQYQDAKARTDRLTQAILAKAFRGELVPQNPDDEPAEVLLERIQAQRAAQAAIPKKSKKAAQSRSKSTTTKPGKQSSKGKNMTQPVTSSDDLLSLLKELGDEIDASALWKKSGLSIDDFYALLKQTDQIEDHNPSSDPAQRKLRVRQ